jgi:hypothetical protein
MIVFINEERPYLSWLARHPLGFVADCLRRPTKKQPVLHRAGCSEVKQSRTKKTHWTTSRHVKACSLDLVELTGWLRDEYDADPAHCAICRPEPGSRANAPRGAAAERDHLTKLGKEIVDCVLEIAVVRLDGGVPHYTLTLADVAELLGKTPRQLTAALVRLIADEYLAMDEKLVPDEDMSADHTVYPTTKALRTLPAFQDMKFRDVEEERRRLLAAGS